MPNNDLIPRAAALKAIDGMKPMQGSTEQLVMKSLCWAAVKTIQPVDAVPVVHGRWITKQRGWGDTDNTCSACGVDWYLECGTPEEHGMYYCPNCGAKMNGERREDNDGNDHDFA